METTYSLNGRWQGTGYDETGAPQFTFSGQVPGCVHTDLMGSRLPADPFKRDNADACQWVENWDWEYTRTFSLDAIPANPELVFEGLDVYADVFLNNIHLGFCNNMFIPWVFPVTDGLRLGENTLTVHFHSPIAQVAGLPTRPAAFTAERLYTRRMQCTYGWDWVARFVTCGIFREVYLRSREGLTTDSLYVYTEHIQDGTAQIAFEATFSGYEAGGIVEADILSPTGETVYRHRFYVQENFLREHVDLPDARLWYPAGYGDQPLYRLRVGNATTVFGIRTVHIQQLPDTPGSAYHSRCLAVQDTPSGKEYDRNTAFSGFRLLVNGLPVMCKGANWVPCEPFPSAETPEKLTRLLELSREAGVNMVRVWGGGIFEQEHFYATCDRLGLMVTQDFLMACGTYPEEQPEFLEQLRKETRTAALRLRNHPALMWWSGDNENAIRGHDEADSYNGRAATHQAIMPVLQQLDPRRRFLLSSPYGGALYASKTVGTTHNTQYLNYLIDYIQGTDMTNYKEYLGTYTARFIAEEPAMGAVTLPSLRKFLTEEDIFTGQAMWEYHTKGDGLFALIDAFAQKVLGDYENEADRFFKRKYVHYEWMRVSFETARRNKGFCNGLIYWMLNDCWPAAAGWSIIDYYGLPKPAFYSFKRCAGAVVASVTPSPTGYTVHVSNDSHQEHPLTLTVYGITEDAARVLTERPVIGKADATVAIEIEALPLPENEILVCDLYGKGVHDRAFFCPGTLPLKKAEAVTLIEDTGTAITLTAHRYVHAVELEGEAVFEDNYFSLLPGERKTMSVRRLVPKGDISLTGYTLCRKPSHRD